jgi:hypothetical protein
MSYFNQKLMVSALAAVAAASANAAIQPISTTGSELFLAVWDPDTNKSYVRDLGVLLSDFLPGGTTAPSAGTYAFGATPTVVAGNVTSTGYTLTFQADPVLRDNFGSNLATANYQIYAGKDGAAFNYLLTSQADVSANLPLNSLAAQLNTAPGAVIATANTFATNTTQDNGSMYTNDPLSDANIGKSMQDNLGQSGLTFKTTAPIGQALSFWSITKGPGTPSATKPALAADYGLGRWNLNQDGTLTWSVTAVPEPGTWAMLAAGLLAVGAIARRRIAG